MTNANLSSSFLQAVANEQVRLTNQADDYTRRIYYIKDELDTFNHGPEDVRDLREDLSILRRSRNNSLGLLTNLLQQHGDLRPVG